MFHRLSVSVKCFIHATSSVRARASQVSFIASLRASVCELQFVGKVCSCASSVSFQDWFVRAVSSECAGVWVMWAANLLSSSRGIGLSSELVIEVGCCVSCL